MPINIHAAVFRQVVADFDPIVKRNAGSLSDTSARADFRAKMAEWEKLCREHDYHDACDAEKS